MMDQLIDFHSHILPGIDDGSRSVQESLEMLKREAEQGISCVIATPHFYARHDHLQDFLRRQNQAELQLRDAMQDCAGLPEVRVGAEVYYFSGISDSDSVKELTIDRGKHILIEMPHGSWTDSMYRDLERLYLKQGLTPIIAHVDRYIGGFRGYGILKRLAELPVLVQANAEFFLNPGTASRALRMLRKGQIQLLGSDCHNLTTRPPNLGSAAERIREKLGETGLQEIGVCQQACFDD